MNLNIRNAYFIKLGPHGKWEADSIKHGRLRFGWREIPLRLIQQGRWDKIRKLINDSKSLQRICESSPEDIWITFYQHRLWWCRLKRAQVRKDSVSKYRKVKGKWHDENLKGDLLSLDQIPGTLAKVQHYRATCCRVKELETLRSLLLGEPSEAYKKLEQARSDAEIAIASSIRSLHWKDFEILTDLLFVSRTGWRRIGGLGGTTKNIDLELKDILTKDIYHVQVKSQASAKDFKKFCDSRPANVRRSYFVVHTPTDDLTNGQHAKGVELLLPKDLAPLVVQFGLVNWVADRTRYLAQI